MIILLYSAAILIETILLVNYLRLRLVEVRLPKPSSSLVKHLNIFQGNINKKSFERWWYFILNISRLFFLKHKTKTWLPKFTRLVCISETHRLNWMLKNIVSHAADFFDFLIHKVVCFVYALFDFVELFVTLVHVLYMSYEKWNMVCLLVLKVSKVAKIRNRYNQVPHLTQDTNGKVTNAQKTQQTRAKRSALSQQVTTKHI